MGLFDNNIHLNGAGTSYQSFLRLADEAEQKGGKIGGRTVRLVRAGDGLRQGALLPRQDLRHPPDRDPDDDGEQREPRLRPLRRAALRRLRRQQGEGRAEGQRLHDVEDQALGSHHPLRSGRQGSGRAAENRRQDRLPVRRGGLLAEELFRFVSETNAAITDADERKAIHGSEEYSSFMSTATDLLFSLHPDIAGGVRGLEAAARDRLFDDAGTLTTDKSREIQQQRRDGLDLAQAQALALGAKHWSSANACLLQLQQDLQA